MPIHLEIIPTSLDDFTPNYIENLLNDSCTFYDEISQKFILGEKYIKFESFLSSIYKKTKFSVYKSEFEYEVCPAIEYIDCYPNYTEISCERIASSWEEIGFTLCITPYSRYTDRESLEFKNFSLAIMQAINGIAFIESDLIFNDLTVGLYDLNNLKKKILK